MSQNTSGGNEIFLTDAALKKIDDLAKKGDGPFLRLRISYGGCQGFQYIFSLEKTKDQEDWLETNDNGGLLVDAVSRPYLQGSTIDYKETPQKSEFVVQNPQTHSSCGCGHSFSPRQAP